MFHPLTLVPIYHTAWHHITSHATANFILLAVKLMSDRQQRALIATRKTKQVKRENVFLLRPKQIQEQASDCRIPADGSIVLEMEWKTSSKLGRRGEKCWVQTLITWGRSAKGYPNVFRHCMPTFYTGRIVKWVGKLHIRQRKTLYVRKRMVIFLTERLNSRIRNKSRIA